MLRSIETPEQFAACRDRFFATPLADAVLPWCFPDLSRAEVLAQTQAFAGTEDFQFAYVNPMLQRILRETSGGLSISGLEQLPRDRKFLFISNHRCIVTDAALVSLNLLASGRGTCKVCVGDNLMASPGVAELMLLLNGVVIKRTGNRRAVYDSACEVARYLAAQIREQRYSVWLSQSPGRTKDGNDHTDPAIIKMLALSGAQSAADWNALNIVPVAISYEFEPCATHKVRETLLRQAHGHYVKSAGEDVEQIRHALVHDKGRVHLAFGQPLELEQTSTRAEQDAPSDSQQSDLVADIAARIDRQIWQLYRRWDSHLLADALLRGEKQAAIDAENNGFAARLSAQTAELAANGLNAEQAYKALLQMYAWPVRNAAA